MQARNYPETLLAFEATGILREVPFFQEFDDVLPGASGLGLLNVM